jgi:carboxyl-terminal processing protease
LSPENKERWIVLQPLILSVMMAVGIMIGFRMSENKTDKLIEEVPYQEGHRMIGRVEELIRFVENRYVDPIDSDVLIDEALQSVFKKLDPHSIYISPFELEDINDQMNGSFYGIGIETFMINDTVHIGGLMPESPAMLGGIRIFDKIIAIDDTLVAGKELHFDEVRKMLRRKNGENVKLEIERSGQRINVSLTPARISVRSVVNAFIVDDSIAYISLDRFSSNTYKEFMEEVELLFDKAKAKHLILDLRGNPGGYLPEATNLLCQIFEEKDRLLVYTEGKNNKRNEYNSTGKRFFSIDQVAVLIDENSASASEIIAGAIQDWDRGVIIGRRSFGKGLVQEQYDLNNGGAVRLTVARYYTPSGRCIQKSYHDLTTYDDDIHDRYSNGYLFDRDSTLLNSDTTHYYSKLLKRKLLANGGINPDIFVPLNSALQDENILQTEYLIAEFIFKQMSEGKIKKVISNDVSKNLTVDDKIFSELKSYAGLPANFEERRLKKYFWNNIRYHIIKYSMDSKQAALFDSDNDPFVVKARDYIRNKKSLSQLN